MSITFNGYTFDFWVLTTGNRYEPAQFAVTETSDGMVARASTLTYGDGSGSTPGLLEVSFAQHGRGFSWQARAAHAEPIKGIRAAIRPLPVGPVMIPSYIWCLCTAEDVRLGTEFNLKEGEPGRCFVYPGGWYPERHFSTTNVEPRSGGLPHWAAQFALLRDGDRTLYLHAREHPPRVKKVWVYRFGEHQEFRLYSEADACRRGTEYTAPTWSLDEVADWRQAVDDHSRWMASAFGLRPLAQRVDVQPWLKQLSLAVILHGLSHDGKICHDFPAMTQRLEELATLCSPQRTLVQLVGFDGRVDHCRPDNTPSTVLGGNDEFSRFMTTARTLGFHVMPDLSVWAASFDNAATQDLLAYQVQDSEGRPMSWSWDYDEDEVAEEIMAYISPDAAQWRAVLRTKVRAVIERHGADAVFLDQIGAFVNDYRYDHFRGLRTIFAELRADFPGVQFAGEGPTTEVSASLCPLLRGVSATAGDNSSEMHRRLFGPYILEWAHSASLPPEPYRGAWSVPPGAWWSEERFLAEQECAAQVNGIPTLNLTDSRIRLDGQLALGVLARARRYMRPDYIARAKSVRASTARVKGA